MGGVKNYCKLVLKVQKKLNFFEWFLNRLLGGGVESFCDW